MEGDAASEWGAEDEVETGEDKENIGMDGGRGNKNDGAAIKVTTTGLLWFFTSTPPN